MIQGNVQGIGVRPKAFQLAKKHGNLTGFVQNTLFGLQLEVEGLPHQSQAFMDEFTLWLHEQDASLYEMKCKEIPLPLPLNACNAFVIKESSSSASVSQWPPRDRAPCSYCLSELNDPHNRRYRYPFISCAQCGPRYSVLNNLPWDRKNTSYDQFRPCCQCQREYQSDSDHRFHAQTISCPECGPRLTWLSNSPPEDLPADDIILKAVEFIRYGKIIAVKGVGGFLLLADAANPETIGKLRQRKKRPRKALALLVHQLEEIKNFVKLNEQEWRALQHYSAPIVLLEKRVETDITAAIAPKNAYLGMMLPSSPLLMLIKKQFNTPLIATSANISGAPITFDLTTDREQLLALADGIIDHDLSICFPIDDSVISLVGQKKIIHRFGRGLAPLISYVDGKEDDFTILGLGAEEKLTFSFKKNHFLFTSPQFGDADNYDVWQRYHHQLQKTLELFKTKPNAVVRDYHDDYMTSRLSSDFKVPIKKTLHHMAHAYSTFQSLAPRNRSELIFSWDGTGIGNDEVPIWGAEVWLKKHSQSLVRIGTLAPFVLPGGKKGVSDARYSAYGLIRPLFSASPKAYENILKKLMLTSQEIKILATMIENKVNCFPSSSMGRLFDGVGALLGIAYQNTYEAEVAIALEKKALDFSAKGNLENNKFELFSMSWIWSKNRDLYELQWHTLIKSILLDLDSFADIGLIAYRFHLSLAAAIVSLAEKLQVFDIQCVGGTFQNTLLMNLLSSWQSDRYKIHWPNSIAINDGGISLGQCISWQD